MTWGELFEQADRTETTVTAIRETLTAHRDSREAEQE